MKRIENHARRILSAVVIVISVIRSALPFSSLDFTLKSLSSTQGIYFNMTGSRYETRCHVAPDTTNKETEE
jgi:hypothetical protein